MIVTNPQNSLTDFIKGMKERAKMLGYQLQDKGDGWFVITTTSSSPLTKLDDREYSSPKKYVYTWLYRYDLKTLVFQGIEGIKNFNEEYYITFQNPNDVFEKVSSSFAKTTTQYR